MDADNSRDQGSGVLVEFNGTYAVATCKHTFTSGLSSKVCVYGRTAGATLVLGSDNFYLAADDPTARTRPPGPSRSDDFALIPVLPEPFLEAGNLFHKLQPLVDYPENPYSVIGCGFPTDLVEYEEAATGFGVVANIRSTKICRMGTIRPDDITAPDTDQWDFFNTILAPSDFLINGEVVAPPEGWHGMCGGGLWAMFPSGLTLLGLITSANQGGLEAVNINHWMSFASSAGVASCSAQDPTGTSEAEPADGETSQ